MQMIDVHMLLSQEHHESFLVCDISCQLTNETVGSVMFCPCEQEAGFPEAAKAMTGLKRKDPPKTDLSKIIQKPKCVKLKPTNTQVVPKPPSDPVTRGSQNTKVDVSSMMSVNHNLLTNEKTFECLFCTFETSHMSSITRHIETKHLPSSVVFNCRSCNYSSKFKHNLKSHYMKAHNMPAPAAEGMLTCM